MKKSTILASFAFFVIFSYLSTVPTIANGGENSCILKAAVDVVVEVWDVDDLGNKGQRTWKGKIKQGEKKDIESQHGQIRYAYSTNMTENEPLSGDIGRPCFDGNIISVP
jgi:hypothetical protein